MEKKTMEQNFSEAIPVESPRAILIYDLNCLYISLSCRAFVFKILGKRYRGPGSPHKEVRDRLLAASHENSVLAMRAAAVIGALGSVLRDLSMLHLHMERPDSDVLRGNVTDVGVKEILWAIDGGTFSVSAVQVEAIRAGAVVCSYRKQVRQLLQGIEDAELSLWEWAGDYTMRVFPDGEGILVS